MFLLWKFFLLPLITLTTNTLTATLPQGKINTEILFSANDNNDSFDRYINAAAAAADALEDKRIDNSPTLDVDHDGRIIGGEATSIANYPYLVSVQHQKFHICGGSIIKPNIILTAAHCVENPLDVKSFQVRAGSSTHHRGGQLLSVHQIIKHESYTFINLDCDVALLVLSRNLTLNAKVQPVELAPSNAMVPSQEALYVSGWGLTSETGMVSRYLNHVAVALINRHNCEKNYQFVATITRQMFCAGYPQGGKDSCQGDSGGPLVSYAVPLPQLTVDDNNATMSGSSSLISSSSASSPLLTLSLLSPASATKVSSQSSLSLSSSSSSSSSSTSSLLTATKSLLTQSGRIARKPIQYGIVSWGVGCAQSGFPGVYADVGALRPWIDAKLKLINSR